MDHHGNTTEDLSLCRQSITQMMYSCNKFYPDAPDTSNVIATVGSIGLSSFEFVDATKFLNDNYVLACALDDGQVLFLNSYQDASPTRVNTELQSKSFASTKAFAIRSIVFSRRYQNRLVIAGRNPRRWRPSTHQRFELSQSNHLLHSTRRLPASCSYSTNGS